MDNVISDEFLQDANVVEIHYVNEAGVGTAMDVESLNSNGLSAVPLGFNKPPRFVPREYRRHVQRMVEYAHKNMTYSYDTANDAQRNVVRSTVRDAVIGSYYIRALAEDVLPCHQFPCTNEIHNIAHVERTTYTIHNRLIFLVDYVCERSDAENDTGAAGTGYYTYTLRYSHAENADRPKIMQIFREAIASIKA